jgi:hypothetical protein
VPKEALNLLGLGVVGDQGGGEEVAQCVEPAVLLCVGDG